MDMSQGPVERKAHGARMPTDPPLPSSPLPKGGEKEKRESKKAKQEMHLKMLQPANKCLTSAMDKRTEL